MRYLKNATATKITVGPFLDVTDGVTPLTSLTVTNATFTILSDVADTPHVVATGALAASESDNDLVHISTDTAGFWSMELSAANTTHLGRLVVSVMDNDVFFPISHEFTVLPEQVYDSLILGTDYLDVNTYKINETTQTARDIGASVLLSEGTGTGQVTLTSGRVNADVTHIATAAVSTGSAQLGVNVVSISGDSVAADNCEAFFDGNGYAGTGNTIPTVTTTASVTALGAQAKLDVNAEVDTALSDINIDHLCGTASGIPTLPANTWLDTIITDGSATYDRTTDSLQAIRDNTSTVAEMATGVWAAAVADNDDAGSMGEALGNASAAGDPWATASMSSTYTTPNTAGYILAHANGAVSGIAADTDEILTRIPDATPGAAGGLFIAGSNAATSITTGLTSNIIGNVTGTITGNLSGNVTGSVGSVSAVGDKSGYSLSAAAYTAAADALLNREMGSVTEPTSPPPSRTVLQALRILRNKWTISAGTLTVCKENDSTSSWTATTTTSVMNPISGVDPA